MKPSFLIAGLAAGCAAILNAQDPPTYLQPQQPPSIVQQPAGQAPGDPFVGDTPADVPQPQQPAETTPQQPVETTPPTAPETPPVGVTPEPGLEQPSGRTYVGGLPPEGAPPEEPSVADMPQPTYAPPPLPVQPIDAYQYFYQPLMPYGEWIFIPGYGNCWRPVGIPYGWRPYWDGNWAWSECGWLWASDEPWGWATYHYGRWMLTSEFGWMWVPGRRWAPAWVCWRRGPDFVCWAPLPPGAPLGVGFYSGAFSISIGCWTMVFERDFLSPHCRHVAFPIHRHHEFLPRATTVVNVTQVNNIVVNAGPGRHHIERVAGRTLPTLRVRSAEVTAADARVTTRVHSDAIVVHQPTRAIMAKPADTTRIKRAEKVTVVSTPITDVPARSPRTTTTTTTHTERTGAPRSDTTTHRVTTRTATEIEAPKGKPAKIGATTTTTTRTVESPKGVTTTRDAHRHGDPPSTTTVQPQPPARVKTVTPPPATTTAPATTTPSTTRTTDTKARSRRHEDSSPTVQTPPPPARIYTPKETPRTVAPATTTTAPPTYKPSDVTPRTRRYEDTGSKVSTPPPSPPARTYTPPPKHEERSRVVPTTPRVTAPAPAATTTTATTPATEKSKGKKPKSDDLK
ncbi:MAG: hypothetical protein HZA91_04025 [Verrucomicrobia bacterium]|nr:hypothetical protein [Verrucomicrobiota bacterium]